MTRRPLLALVLVLAFSGPVGAELILTPFVGTTFGGSTQTNHTTFGGSIGFLAGKVFGAEAEYGYVPDAFADATLAATQSSSVQSVSFNFVLAIPAKRLRPYGSAGLSVLSSDVGAATSERKYNAGYNLGGGLFIWLGKHVGLRGDIRFFQTFGNLQGASSAITLGKLDYWRGVGGITLRF